jgi:hypothetical protein
MGVMGVMRVMGVMPMEEQCSPVLSWDVLVNSLLNGCRGYAVLRKLPQPLGPPIFELCVARLHGVLRVSTQERRRQKNWPGPHRVDYRRWTQISGRRPTNQKSARVLVVSS